MKPKIKVTGKRALCPPFGYAYEQDDGSWIVPGEEQGNRWEYEISSNGKTITMRPLDEAIYYIDKVDIKYV